MNRKLLIAGALSLATLFAIGAATRLAAQPTHTAGAVQVVTAPAATEDPTRGPTLTPEEWAVIEANDSPVAEETFLTVTVSSYATILTDLQAAIDARNSRHLASLMSNSGLRVEDITDISGYTTLPKTTDVETALSTMFKAGSQPKLLSVLEQTDTFDNPYRLSVVSCCWTGQAPLPAPKPYADMYNPAPKYITNGAAAWDFEYNADSGKWIWHRWVGQKDPHWDQWKPSERGEHAQDIEWRLSRNWQEQGDWDKPGYYWLAW
jgi:hypothetical protein